MKKGLLLNLMMLCILTVGTVKINAQVFTEQVITGLPNIGQGHSAMADYDNDGKMDLILTGDTSSTVDISRLYHNEGNGKFTDVTATAVPGLPGVKRGCVAWCDYNNDGFMDFIISGYTASGNIIKLYKNNGNGTFTEQKQALFYPLSMPSLVWGDYNNDGLPDLLISGSFNSSVSSTDKNLTTRLYRNNGDGTFTDINAPFGGLDQTSAAWLDYDNDGFLDCIISGYTGTTYIYKNNGDGTFTAKGNLGLQTNMLKVNCFQNSMSIGDYNHDGYLDILESGANGGSSGQTILTRVYKNNGNGTGFTLAFTLNTNFGESSVAWGDFDNDGWLDILANGQSYASTYPVTSLGMSAKVFRNNNGISFDTLSLALPGRRYNSSFWLDYNNDKKLDFLLIGTDNTANSYTGKAKLYLSSVTNASQIPTAPTNLIDSVSTIHNNVTLKWDKSTDPQTNTKKGITYNLRVFTKSSGKDVDIISPMADTITGARKISALGSITGDTTQTKKTSYLLKGLKPGIYYWRVQAINEAFYGGPWSVQDSFIITGKQQASNITFTNITPSTIRISWTNGDYGQRIVMVDSGMIAYNTTLTTTTLTAGMPVPINNTTYAGNATFGAGTRIGTTGWYCVYNGTGNYVDITGLNVTNTSATGKHYSLKYAVAVLEYSGSAGSENYNINAAYANSALMPPLVNASNILGSAITTNSFTATWKNGSGVGRAVFVHQGSATTNTNIPIPNNISYNANSTFGSGDQINNSGWFCVYNGTGTTINVTGLQVATTYTTRVCEFNTFSGISYLAQDTISNPVDMMPDYSAPLTQASSIQIQAGSYQFDASWTNGTGTGRVVFISQGNTGTPIVSNNQTYTPNTVFGQGYSDGNGWYCVYNGVGNSVSITGLALNTQYRLAVYEYNGTPGLEKYLTSGATGNPFNQFTDSRLQQVITFALVDVTYGNPPFYISAKGGTSGNPIIFTSSDPTIVTIADSTVTIVGTGTVNITANQAGNSSYADAAPQIRTLNVNKATQTISFAALPTNTFGDIPFNLTATGGGSGNPITYISKNTAVATISGSTVTIVGAGSDTIIASQAASTNYLAAKDSAQILTVNRAPQTISFNALPTKNYLDAPFDITATASSGLTLSFVSANTDIATVSGTTITILKAGVVKFTASQSGNINYLAAANVSQNLTINKLSQTISFNPLPTYKNTDPDAALTATASSGLRVTYKCGDLGIAAIEGSILADSIHFFGAGTTTITATQVGNDYYAAATPVIQTLTVTSSTGTIQLTDGNLMVYPNPASDKITISFAKSVDNVSIIIYSLTGEQVTQLKLVNNPADVDISNLKSGVYLIRIISSEGVTMKQIVKQ